MKIFILPFAFILFSIKTFPQTVTVTDKTNLQPLPLVTIHSERPEASATTNSNGQADIRSFKGADSILFRHVGYLSKIISYNELSVMNFSVGLSEQSYSLDEAVISSSRFEEKREDVVQTISVIKPKDLAFMNQQSSADVIQNTGNVLIQKSQQGGGSPIIRGFEANKVLVVIDGVRMNNAIYRNGHIQNIITLDNTVMDKVEIVFGPGSVVYGSDALGGVMHYYTKNPLLSDTGGTIVKTNVFTRYSSANNEKTGHVDFTLGSKNIGSLTSVTYSDFGDLRQGNNRNPEYGSWGKRTFYTERINGKDSMFVNDNFNIQKPSGYKQYDVLQKFLFRQSDKTSHTLNIQYSTSSDIPRYDRLTITEGSKPVNAKWYYGPQKRLLGSYSLNHANNNKMYDNGRIIIAYQNIEESRHDRKFDKTIINHRIEKLDIITVNADFSKKVNRNEIRYGTEETFNKINSTAHKDDIVTGASLPLDTRYPDGGSTMQTVAVYFTHNYETTKKIILNDGIRVSNIRLKSVFTDTAFFPFPFNEVTQNNTAINGNLGLVFMPGAYWRFTLAGSSGFRAPNVDDLSKVFESVPGSIIVPNPNLKPEYTYNIDLGFSKTIKKKITVGATGFYTMYLSAITTQPGKFNGKDSIVYGGVLSRVIMNVNKSEAYLYGGNSWFSADITDKFSVSGTLNYTVGRIKTDTGDEPLDHIPPLFGKTSFNLQLNKFRGEFFVMYSGAKLSKDYNLSGEDNHIFSADPVKGFMPAWMTLNVRAAYQFNKYVQLQVAMENILDRNYRVFASNISAPGRNFIITLRGSL